MVAGNWDKYWQNQFVKNKVHFWGIIDRQVVECENISVYKTTNIPNEIEAIIITVYSSSLKKEDLAKKTKAKILRIEEILSLL